MNEKELREIKRRFRPDRSNVDKIVGCFVNASGQIISRFSQPILLSETDESEELLTVMKKTLSGSLGTNLIDIPFSTRDVMESEEHKLLMALRDTHLRDADTLEKFYARVTESVKIESSYVILLANDVYDVYSGKDEDDGSHTTFSYVVCCVCPLKDVDSGLFFRESDKLFHSVSANAVLTRPSVGFMFPTFDDRIANIYHALFYTRDIARTHEDLINRIFGKAAPMPPKAQKAEFNRCLSASLGEECSFDTVKYLHTGMAEMMEIHKELNTDEPFTVTKAVMTDLLEKCGVDEKAIERTGAAIDEGFGKNAEITPRNVINTRQLELKMPDVQIKVKPEKYDAISTRTVNGKKYVMIEADAAIEINGIPVVIDD